MNGWLRLSKCLPLQLKWETAEQWVVSGSHFGAVNNTNFFIHPGKASVYIKRRIQLVSNYVLPQQLAFLLFVSSSLVSFWTLHFWWRVWCSHFDVHLRPGLSTQGLHQNPLHWSPTGNCFLCFDSARNLLIWSLCSQGSVPEFTPNHQQTDNHVIKMFQLSCVKRDLKINPLNSRSTAGLFWQKGILD